MPFAKYLHNLYNKFVLGIRLKTSLFPNISFDRKMHPSVQGIVICTGPKRMTWFEKHSLVVQTKRKRIYRCRDKNNSHCL